MKKILIEGGKRLFGEVHISGAKNSVLPLIAATLLTEGTTYIEESPWLSDVDCMCQVLNHLGAKTTFDKGELAVDTTSLNSSEPPGELVRKMRASFLVMGPMLTRYGRVRMSLPGGCAIGARPIDLHLKGFAALGADIVQGSGFIEATAKRLSGSRIYLDFPSVGATENLIMAASLAEGHTVIENAALEPEIIDLSNMLSAMGAKIKGAGTNAVRIEGVDELKPARHTVIPDRIEAGSFLVMAAATGGELILNDVTAGAFAAGNCQVAGMSGATMEVGYDSIHILGPDKLQPGGYQDPALPGLSHQICRRSLWPCSRWRGATAPSRKPQLENRFMHAQELLRMGAEISIERNCATIQGVSHLQAAEIAATDLRGGAAMVNATPQAARGVVSAITQIEHIERGYENLLEKLEGIGTGVVDARGTDALGC